jgi:benzoyl-CoA reductase/2-hydroxyglutaryl-CoA dehydratase subunit BcrC/BadD/HgdB
MSDYRTMWAGLGMDLDRHDSLLELLGNGYTQTFVSQKDRPESMKYFDFVVSEAHGLRIQELVEHRQKGGTVIGTFCVFVPEDVIFALGGIPVGLCAGADFPIGDSDGLVPRNTCPLIRASLGFKISRTCPYIQASDLVIGETTCDGKKKMFEVLGQHHPTYVMEVPQKRTEAARALFIEEVKALIARLETESGRKLDAAALATATAKVEAKKAAMRRVNAARKATPAPISGLDALLVSQISFYDDIDRFTGKVNELADELETRAASARSAYQDSTPRLLHAGTPIPLPDWKLHSIVESCGGVIVGEESCVGSRYYTTTTPAHDGSLDGQIEAIADRLLSTHCACFTPNSERVDDIVTMAREQGADGVILYSLSFCQTYANEAIKAERALKDAGIPALTLESDFSASDSAQLATRVQAFMEVLR